MYTLIIDSSTEKGLVALAQGDSICFAIELDMRSSEEVVLDKVFLDEMHKRGLCLNDLKAIAVGGGPGFFTSIRKGCALAKGISFAKKLPLIGFCSLSGFTMIEEGRFVSMIDARVRGAFFLIQERKGDTLVELSPPQFCPIERLDFCVRGCKKILGPSLQRFSSLGQTEERYPDALHLASLVEKKFQNGEYSRNGDLDLIYLRPSH